MDAILLQQLLDAAWAVYAAENGVCYGGTN
jgi:hypothetical protein